MGKLSKLKDNHAAWHGDAALSWVTRLMLIKTYPNIPLKFLMCREQAIINNKNLTRFCQENKLDYGCNLFEVEFGKLALGNLGRAQEIVKELMKNNRKLERQDAEQLENGHLKACLLKTLSEKAQRKLLYETGLLNIT